MERILKLIRLTEIKQSKNLRIQLFFSKFVIISSQTGKIEVPIFDYGSISKFFSIKIKNEKRKIDLWFKFLRFLLENKYAERIDFEYRIRIARANKKPLLFTDVDRALKLVGEEL